jgi:ribosomal protein S18 acetylase RimI-like enzyme
MTGVEIREMAGTDTTAVAHLLVSTTEEPLRPYLAYSQPGIDAYLAVLVGWPQLYPDHHLYVGTDDEARVVAFAELRSTGPTSCLLSYVCVAPPARGSGVAARLLSQHLVRRPEIATVELDVFTGNTPAVRLYRRLGFTQVRSARWWTRDLPAASPEAVGEFGEAGWDAAMAMLERYGFCRVSAQRQGRRLDLGLVSRTVIRVGDQEQFRDDDLLGALRFLLPETRQALLVDGPAAEPGPGLRGSRVLLESQRLRADAATVKANSP